MGSATPKSLPAGDDQLLDAFVLEEYRSLCGQLDDQIRETRDLERYALIGIGLIFAWLASLEKPPPLVVPAWLFPPVLAIMGWVRAKSSMQRIDQVAGYLRRIEARVYGASGEIPG